MSYYAADGLRRSRRLSTRKDRSRNIKHKTTGGQDEITSIQSVLPEKDVVIELCGTISSSYSIRQLRSIATKLSIERTTEMPKEQLCKAIEKKLNLDLDSIAINTDEEEMPDGFQDFVALTPLVDPVVASDGMSYNRSTLAKLFAGDNKSPVTRKSFDKAVQLDNVNLKKAVLEWLIAHGIDAQRAIEEEKTLMTAQPLPATESTAMNVTNDETMSHGNRMDRFMKKYPGSGEIEELLQNAPFISKDALELANVFRRYGIVVFDTPQQLRKFFQKSGITGPVQAFALNGDHEIRLYKNTPQFSIVAEAKMDRGGSLFSPRTLNWNYRRIDPTTSGMITKAAGKLLERQHSDSPTDLLNWFLKDLKNDPTSPTLLWLSPDDFKYSLLNFLDKQTVLKNFQDPEFRQRLTVKQPELWI